MINWEIVLEVMYAMCLLGCTIALILHCIAGREVRYGAKYYVLQADYKKQKRYVEALENQIKDLEKQIKDAEKGIGIESIKVIIKDLREDELFTTEMAQDIPSPTISFGAKAVIGGKIYGNFCYVYDENPSLEDIKDTINAQLEEMVESINGGHYDGT